MKKVVRRRFWAELVGAWVCGALFLTTMVWPEWIELAFHVEPDGGSGLLERLIVIFAVAANLMCALLAVFEWRRALVKARTS